MTWIHQMNRTVMLLHSNSTRNYKTSLRNKDSSTRKEVVIRNNRYNAYELQKIKEEVTKKSNTDENSLQKQNHKRRESQYRMIQILYKKNRKRSRN